MARALVYDVALSLDGFIAGPDDDIAHFVPEGDPGLAAYRLERSIRHGSGVLLLDWHRTPTG